MCISPVAAKLDDGDFGDGPWGSTRAMGWFFQLLGLARVRPVGIDVSDSLKRISLVDAEVCWAGFGCVDTVIV